jgi:ribosomal protein S30
LSLAGPVRQQAGEVKAKKEETEEPALHGEELNHNSDKPV